MDSYRIQHCDFLINADFIITQNASREVINDGAIAIKGSHVADIGPAEVLEGRWHPEERLDLSGHIVMPGLINAHTHSAMTFLRGLADDQPLMHWLTKTVFPVEKRLTEEIVYIGSMLGQAEMLATGTTACMDMYIFEASVLEAAETTGMRCTGGEAIFQFPSAACRDHEEALCQTETLAKKYKGSQRIGVAVNPHAIYTTTPRILAESLDLARKLDLPLHMHLSETGSETEQCLSAYGKRPVEYCRSLGLLGEHLVAAHIVDINEEEARILAEFGVRGVHNPTSNMKLSSGLSPISTLQRYGMLPGLGTDGPASNNQLNMFQEMNRTAMVHKLVNADPLAAPARTVLDLATLGGSKVLGNSHIGKLELGCVADLIALNLEHPNMQPIFDPISQVVYAASGHEVDLTMVQGEIMYRNGKFTRFDYGDLLARVDELRRFALSQ